MSESIGRLSERFKTVWETFLSPSSARSLVWRKVAPPRDCFNPANSTKADRFPLLFSEIKDQLGSSESCRILSFGCSTGEEVFSLRNYLPDAEIVGIDINPSSIAHARRVWASRGADPRLSFHAASSCIDQPRASFDAILAMTVFCSARLRVKQPETCAGHLSFAAFDAEIARFADRLKPGGLLIVGNANFRVDDTTAADRFVLVRRLAENAVPGLQRPIYGADERLIDGLMDRGAIYRLSA